MENSYVLRLTEQRFKDMYLSFCGFSDCEPLHSFGPATRPSYIIHIITKGKGNYYVDGKRYSLEKGQGFLIEPDVITFYQADANEPWSYTWIGFGGEEAKKILQEMGLVQKSPIFRTGIDCMKKLKSMIMEMMSCKDGSTKSELKLQGLFYMFMSVLVKDVAVIDGKFSVSSNPHIQKALEFIHKNYGNNINVNEVADYIKLNRSYFSTLFQKNVGMTVQKYLTIFRISRANELLDITENSIESIAEDCGYNDPLVFSKVYKKMYGITPTQHRKFDRKNMEDKLKQIKK